MGNRHQRLTLLDLVDSNAIEHPDALALVDGENRLSWSEYRAQARAIALVLLDLGVGRGDVVGLHMVNRAEHVLADVGAVMAGAIPCSYYNSLAAEQLAWVAADSAASAVASTSAMSSLIFKAVSRTACVVCISSRDRLSRRQMNGARLAPGRGD